MLSVPLIHALTRPAMVFGVTYNYFALLLVLSLSVTFLTKWYVFALVLTVSLYIVGRWLAAHDPQWLDGFLVLRQKCKYQRNYNYWGCRTYAPW